MPLKSIALPFNKMYQHLSLEKLWWHRSCVIVYFAALICTMILAATFTYTELSPKNDRLTIWNMDDGASTPIGDNHGTNSKKSQQNSTDYDRLSDEALKEEAKSVLVIMPDYSQRRFPKSVAYETILAQWNQDKDHCILVALIWSVVGAVFSTIFMSYALQLAHRLLIYVVLGKSEIEHVRS